MYNPQQKQQQEQSIYIPNSQKDKSNNSHQSSLRNWALHTTPKQAALTTTISIDAVDSDDDNNHNDEDEADIAAIDSGCNPEEYEPIYRCDDSSSSKSSIVMLRLSPEYQCSAIAAQTSSEAALRRSTTRTRRYVLESAVTNIVSSFVSIDPIINYFPIDSRIKDLVTASALESDGYITTTSHTACDSNIDRSNIDFNCLSDLPLFDNSKFIRLLLCRHGETENNRLNLMQDAPINGNGICQATCLGQALWTQQNHQPEIIFHSPLLRAKQTAAIAASQFQATTNTSTAFATNAAPQVLALSTLFEVDFGSDSNSEPVDVKRAKRYATYAAWSVGELDVRMEKDGESGREVLQRIEKSINAIIDAASTRTQSGIVAAVSHSVFIRMLLTFIQPSALLDVSRIEQSNCCINVIDFPRQNVHRTTNNMSNTSDIDNPDATQLSRLASIAGYSTALQTTKDLPGNPVKEDSILKQGKILRINENRHIPARDKIKI